MVKEVVHRADDPDRALPDWRAQGCPMGIKCEILAGSWFPPHDDPAAESSLADLDAQQHWTVNHPSFRRPFADSEELPGMDLI